MEPDEPRRESSAGVVSAGMSRRGGDPRGRGGCAGAGPGRCRRWGAGSAGSRPEPPGGKSAHLSVGFWKTFTSRYINVGGSCQYAVTGGEGKVRQASVHSVAMI